MYFVARQSQTNVGSLRVVRNPNASKSATGTTVEPMLYPEEMEAQMHADALNAAAVAEGGTPGTFKVYRLTECVTVPDPVVPE